MMSRVDCLPSSATPTPATAPFPCFGSSLIWQEMLWQEAQKKRREEAATKRDEERRARAASGGGASLAPGKEDAQFKMELNKAILQKVGIKNERKNLIDSVESGMTNAAQARSAR